MANFPLLTKLAIISFACFGIAAAGYWYELRDKNVALKNLMQRTDNLKIQYRTQYCQVAQIAAYKQQIREIERLAKERAAHLRARPEVTQLIKSIAKTSSANGLTLLLVKPLAKENYSNYSKYPLQISVSGEYSRFEKFISQLLKLQSTIAVEDFSIETKKIAAGQNQLIMNLLIKNYSYEEKKDSNIPSTKPLNL